MNRARRSVLANKKRTTVKVSDDDFESGTDEDGDFSASEEEWLPGKDKKSKRSSGSVQAQEPVTESEDTDELDEDDDLTENSESDASSVVFKQTGGTKRSSKGSPKQHLKKKRLSPGTRDELYKRTKKHLLKNPDPERPSLNSSLSDILKNCKFKKKKDIAQIPRLESTAKKAKIRAHKSDESDSSGDDHLVSPEKLDLNSGFFDRVQIEEMKTAPITFDCNAGVRLSDSSGEDEQLEENLPASIPKSAANNLISKINESSSGLLNFNNLGEFTTKMEEAKQLLRNYQPRTKSSQENSEGGEDVSNLLALGEAEADVSSGKQIKISQQDDDSINEESDWEEVEEAKKSQKTQKPPDDYQITVEVETSKSKKERWEEIEMELYIKRQINKVKRDNQMAYHKSSVLCTIALGLRLNEILNSDKMKAMALSLMQSKKCLPKGKVDGKFVQQMMEWFKDTLTLKSQAMLVTNSLNLRCSLALGFFTKQVACKRDFLLLFLGCMRVVGVQCRLVISANTPPKRPAMKDLCPISERQLIEKFEKEYCKKSHLQNGHAHDSSVQSLDKMDDSECRVDETGEKNTPQSNSGKTPKAANIQNDSNSQIKEVNSKKAVSKKDILKQENTITVEHVHSSHECKMDETGDDASKSSAINKKIPRKSVPKIEVDYQTDNPSRCTRSRSKMSPMSDGASSDTSKQIHFSLIPVESKRKSKPPTPSPSSKENVEPTKSILRRSSPRTSGKINQGSSQTKTTHGTLCIPQLDGISDIVSTPKSVPFSRRLRSRAKTNTIKAEQDDGTHFTRRARNTPTAKEQNNNQPGKILKRKLRSEQPLMSKNKILSACSSSESEAEAVFSESQPSPALNKKRTTLAKKRIKPLPADSDYSDFEPPGEKKTKKAKTKSELSAQKKKSAGGTSKKKKSASKVEEKEPIGTDVSGSGKTDMWFEFFSEKDSRWIAGDLFTGKIDCVDYIARHATAPISYVFGFDNQNHVKDITPRYVQHWNTVSRKLRVEPKWLDKALKPFKAEKTDRESIEDAELNKIHIDKPLPTTIAECKNHPLYVLKRHLLKYEALYPADLPSLGFVRGEAIYARECLFILQTREKWFKQGRVVKAFETAYKVVKCWKYDKPNNVWLKNQPCDIFGIWQTEEYDPPAAENGRVPRNEYGNVELFVPRMLPKKTVHLQLPGLNRVCRRLGIDCAPALTGFEKVRMRMVPVYDGFVVCEEFANEVTEEWYKEMELEEQKEQEKYEKRVYGNWKRLIRGVLVRRKLQNKYNFDNL
ncbi:DNA repair protein complementing XP-C cells homolog [Topomyia yanbarensis]|uniref:DNA repair protein complementing XP-C cells homolog n=1 Tax=Topomyia yanbarensis TaxID=2498891 RepID=UPI00273AC0E2|nr:DNA repair protein complementing XP-C cells homolog [Topomyia yanbarensis]